MLANINNISYIQDQEGFHIMVEFSVLPIDTFETKEEADEFILGYHFGWGNTEAMRNGRQFKTFVNADLKLGIKYMKQNNPHLRLVR
jgi:hypothetical protein